MVAKKLLGTMIRVGVSSALIVIVFLFLDADVDQFWLIFRQLDPVWALGAVALMFVQLMLTALRWSFVNEALGNEITLRTCLRLMFIGQFFNQSLPTSIGGDGVKVGMLCRVEKIPLQMSFLSVVADRVVGLLVLILVACLAWLVFGYLWPIPIPQQATISTILLAAVCAVATALFVIFPRIDRMANNWNWRGLAALRTFAATSNRLFLHKPVALNILGLSVIVQVLIALSIYCGSRSLQVDLPLAALFLIPLIIFVASLPFSFAGWGLREGAMVTGFAILGISATEAVSASILHGIAQLIIGLPGAYMAATQIGLGAASKLSTER